MNESDWKDWKVQKIALFWYTLDTFITEYTYLFSNHRLYFQYESYPLHVKKLPKSRPTSNWTALKQTKNQSTPFGHPDLPGVGCPWHPLPFSIYQKTSVTIPTYGHDLQNPSTIHYCNASCDGNGTHLHSHSGLEKYLI